MKMMIPPLGARIRLSAEWSFDLHYEYRNENVYDLFGVFQHLKGTVAGYAEDAYPPLHRIDEADKEPARVTLPEENYGPDSHFLGRRNSSVSARWLLVSDVIGYVVKP